MNIRRNNIDPDYVGLSICKQCDLLGVARSSFYYDPVPESDYNLRLMDLIDRKYMESPCYGRRRMRAFLFGLGHCVNHKKVQRLMQVMGIEAIYPKPKREAWRKKHGTYPYLLKGMEFTAQNKVWATDITYIPVGRGYLYLVAVMDLYSRFVLDWKLSDSLESTFCVEAVAGALKWGKPEILNSDQGVQFTSSNYTNLLHHNGIKISMSGKGRCWDNIFVERFWRTLKYEEVYLNEYLTPMEAFEGIKHYIEIYNQKRLHSSLKYRTPEEVYLAA